MSRAGLRSQQQQSAGGEDSDEEIAGRLQNPDLSSITMSSENFALMMETIQRHQTALTADLIAELRRDRGRRESTPETSTSSTVAALSASLAGANFALCQAKFSGEPYESVENFIDAIEIYKTATGISDDSAVKGMALLLAGSAGTWWQGVKPNVKTWNDALKVLKSAFGERRPPFQIYKDLFGLTQDNQSTDLFVAQARALLARLPEGDVSEKVQLDMVYGLLDIRVRKRIDRDSVTSFEELLRRARSVEDALKDRGRPPPGALPPPLRGAHASPPGAVCARGAPYTTGTSSHPSSGALRGALHSHQSIPVASGDQAIQQSGDKGGHSGNFYPVTSKISIEDLNSNICFSVFVDRAQGGTSLTDGEVDLMLNRRILTDDSASETFANDTEYGQGVVVRGKHHLYISKANYKPYKIFEKKFAKELQLSPQILISRPDPYLNYSKEIWFNSVNEVSFLKTKLPIGIHLLTLEDWTGDTLLLRLENYLEKNDTLRGRSKIVYIQEMFTNLYITHVRETTLGANVWMDDRQKNKFTWPKKENFVRSFNGFYGVDREPEFLKGEKDTWEPVVNFQKGIKLAPQQIRTFVCNFDYVEI